MNKYKLYKLIWHSGKVYVGLTSLELSQRLMEHKSAMLRGVHKSDLFNQTFKEEGFPIIMEIASFFNRKQGTILEKHIIDIYAEQVPCKLLSSQIPYCTDIPNERPDLCADHTDANTETLYTDLAQAREDYESAAVLLKHSQARLDLVSEILDSNFCPEIWNTMNSSQRELEFFEVEFELALVNLAAAELAVEEVTKKEEN